MFENMRKTGLPLITCERDRLLSHFAVHFSPVFYLILPIYMLIPAPETLLVVSAFIVASGAVPLLLIYKEPDLSTTIVTALVFCAIIFPAKYFSQIITLYEKTLHALSRAGRGLLGHRRHLRERPSGGGIIELNNNIRKTNHDRCHAGALDAHKG